MIAWWQRLCGCGKLKTVTTLADALKDTDKSRAILFRGIGEDVLEQVFAEMCDEVGIESYVTSLDNADGALLDHFCVNHVPVCVFIVKNKWTYIMPAPTAATIANAKTWLHNSCA